MHDFLIEGNNFLNLSTFDKGMLGGRKGRGLELNLQLSEHVVENVACEDVLSLWSFYMRVNIGETVRPDLC